MGKDTIYRQDAIDAIESAKTARTPDGEIYVAKLNAEMNIQILPSAEPEKVLIARINLSEEQVREAVERAKNEIVQALPFAESGIIRCGACKYYNAEERLCNDLMGFGRYWDENDFCSFAERRTDATD